MIERPSNEEVLMRVAAVISARGTCNRAYVGAVIALDGRIISTGYVGAPAGMAHCTEIGDEEGPDGGCIRTVHAEANAIAWAARNGLSTEEAELYCTHSPCLRCAQLLINAGIIKVTYEHEYRVREGIDLLLTAGVEVVHMPTPTQDVEEVELLVDHDEDSSFKRIH